jgi:hypothetical protein
MIHYAKENSTNVYGAQMKVDEMGGASNAHGETDLGWKV